MSMGDIYPAGRKAEATPAAPPQKRRYNEPTKSDWVIRAMDAQNSLRDTEAALRQERAMNEALTVSLDRANADSRRLCRFIRWYLPCCMITGVVVSFAVYLLIGGAR